jgi:transmembrane sensor
MTDPDKVARMGQAMDWAIRIQDSEFDGWEQHGRWLLSHPENPEDYYCAVLALEDGAVSIEDTTDRLEVSANDNAPLHKRRSAGPVIGGLAVAASALLMFPFLPVWKGDNNVITVAAGHRRTLALLDGSVIVLNGGSELRLDKARRATLRRGEAYVTVRHDQAHPFELVAVGRTFRDVGTAFNVSIVDDGVVLDVAEGMVLYEPDGAAIRLKAGEGLSISGTEAIRHRIAAASVGSWRMGRLVYRRASLAKVASDLSRATGLPVDVSDGVRRRTFSGVIVLSPDLNATRKAVGDLLDVSIVSDDQGWHLQARP